MPDGVVLQKIHSAQGYYPYVCQRKDGERQVDQFFSAAEPDEKLIDEKKTENTD